LVLVGDAAHSAAPHVAQGGAQAIEDAAVLGESLSRMETPQDLSGAVAAYEAIRKPKCERVQQIAKGNADLLALPDGPGQEARDKMFKEITEMHEKELRESGREGIRAKPKPEPDMNAPNWATPGARKGSYGYDAIEEVGGIRSDLNDAG
jgi:salicylate hydroxylase